MADDQFADADDSDVEDVSGIYKPAQMYRVPMPQQPQYPIHQQQHSTNLVSGRGGGDRPSTSNRMTSAVERAPSSLLSQRAATAFARKQRAAHDSTVGAFMERGGRTSGKSSRMSSASQDWKSSSQPATKPKSINAAAGKSPVTNTRQPTSTVPRRRRNAAPTTRPRSQPQRMDLTGTSHYPSKKSSHKTTAASRTKRSSYSKHTHNKQQQHSPPGTTRARVVLRPCVRRVQRTTVIPDDVIRQQVLRATGLVTAEVRSGVWPPIQQFHQNKLERAACALEQFAMEIILPCLASASRAPPAFSGSKNPNAAFKTKREPPHERTFFATLLLLREVIMMNMKTIFGQDPNAMMEEQDNDDNVPKQDSSHDSPFPGFKRLQQQDVEEEKAFSAHLLATGLILSATERYGRHLLPELSFVLEKYDGGDGEFGSCLEQADGRSVCTMPNGNVLDEQEAICAKVSFNVAREAHPLIAKFKKSNIMDPVHPIVLQHVDNVHETPLHQFSLPQPTACHVCMVERVPTSEHSN